MCSLKFEAGPMYGLDSARYSLTKAMQAGWLIMNKGKLKRFMDSWETFKMDINTKLP